MNRNLSNKSLRNQISGLNSQLVN